MAPVYSELERGLQRLMLGVRADWALYVRFTGSGEEIAVNADAMMDTMSVIKIPLLVALFRASDTGALDLACKYTLETRYKRFGTGVLQAMDDGMVFTLRDAATLMIIESDNTATDYCYEAVGGPDAVNKTMRQLGLDDIDVMGDGFDWFSALAASIDPKLGDLDPAALFRAGYPEMSPAEWERARERFHFETGRPFSRATARCIGKLLEMIWTDGCASPESCAAMRKILGMQISRSRLPKYLPEARVAHKTGDFNPFIANDVGVIESHEAAPIIISVLVAGHRGIWENLEDTIARMAEKIWEYGIYAG
ncbi:MAG: class A beta-lactamase-related serine hydrolase [Chloroflexi bacterium]|nr:class A beta-lactamase-related serine hydrolase [Chloroflexota bacterium]